MKVTLLLISVFLPAIAIADECRKSLQQTIEANKLVETQHLLPAEQKSAAKENLKFIQENTGKLSDCEILEKLPSKKNPTR